MKLQQCSSMGTWIISVKGDKEFKVTPGEIISELSYLHPKSFEYFGNLEDGTLDFHVTIRYNSKNRN